MKTDKKMRIVRWVPAFLLGLSVAVTAIKLQVGLKASFPPGQTLWVMSASLLLALPIRIALDWIWGQFSGYSRALRWVWIGSALLLSSLILCSGFVQFPGMIDHHMLEIVATGEKHPDSDGSEIWLRGIYNGEGQTVPLSELASEGGWVMGVGDRLISASEQPAVLTWEGGASRIKLDFEKSRAGGKVLLRWDGTDRQTLDLYHPEDSSRQVMLAGERSYFVGFVLKCAEIAVLSFVLLLLLAAALWIQWEWPWPRQEDSRHIVDLARQIARAAKEEHWGHWAALGLIVVTGIVFRVLYLDQPMRGDESYTFMNYVRFPLTRALSDYVPNNHVFHTLLARLSYVLFGPAPWALRLPAFAAGAALIPAAYAMARLLFNRWVGLLAAALIAFSPPMLLYSTNARGYAILCLCLVLLVVLAVWLQRYANRWLWLCFAVLSAIGFYTVPVFLYPFATVSGWLFLQALIEPGDPHRQRRLLSGLVQFSLLAGALTLILYAPFFLGSGVTSVTSNQFVAPLSWTAFSNELPSQLALTWRFLHKQMPWWGTLLSAAGFGLGIVFNRKVSAYRLPLAIVCVLVCAVLLFMQKVVPPVRTLIFVVPIYVSTVSAGLFWLYGKLTGGMSKRWMAVLWAVLAVTISVVMNIRIWQSNYIVESNWTATVPNTEEVIGFLRDYVTPDDNLLSSSQATIEYYFSVGGYPPPHWGDEGFEHENRVILVVDTAREVDQYLANKLARHGLCYPECDETGWKKIAQLGTVAIYEY